MSYDTFKDDVKAAIDAKTAIDAFAKVQADGTHFCPRCGRFTVKDRLHTNALSRHASVFICDECGMDEAIRDMMGVPLLLRDWAIAKEQQKGDDEA